MPRVDLPPASVLARARRAWCQHEVRAEGGANMIGPPAGRKLRRRHKEGSKRAQQEAPSVGRPAAPSVVPPCPPRAVGMRLRWHVPAMRGACTLMPRHLCFLLVPAASRFPLPAAASLFPPHCFLASLPLSTHSKWLHVARSLTSLAVVGQRPEEVQGGLRGN